MVGTMVVHLALGLGLLCNSMAPLSQIAMRVLGH